MPLKSYGVLKGEVIGSLPEADDDHYQIMVAIGSQRWRIAVNVKSQAKPSDVLYLGKVGLPAPLGPCAANIADVEIRGAATVGGNVCAGGGFEAPRGDLQGALIAVGATVRSAGEGGISEDPLEDFLSKRDARLVLDVSYEEPAAGAFACLDRPHTHDYTTLAVSGAKLADGTVRLAVTGAGSHGQRLASAEGGDADAALQDVTPHDDALA